jgi:hypothetical protein
MAARIAYFQVVRRHISSGAAVRFAPDSVRSREPMQRSASILLIKSVSAGRSSGSEPWWSSISFREYLNACKGHRRTSHQLSERNLVILFPSPNLILAPPLTVDTSSTAAWKSCQTLGHPKVLPQRQHATHLRLDGLLTLGPDHRDRLGSYVSMTQANGLAASDADCSNAAFFRAQPFTPQFSSSGALIRSCRELRPSAGTPIRIGAGKRHSDSTHEAGTGGRALLFDSAGRSDIPPKPMVVRFGNPGVPPDRGFLLGGRDSFPSKHGRRNHLGTRLVGAPSAYGKSDLSMGESAFSLGL